MIDNQNNAYDNHYMYWKHNFPIKIQNFKISLLKFKDCLTALRIHAFKMDLRYMYICMCVCM